MTTASWALLLPLPHRHIWCNGGGGRGASEVPRAKAAIEGPTEGTGALWFGSASLQGWNSGEARKWGGEVRAFWKDKWGGGAWGREGTHPALGPRGVRWPWPPPTLLFFPALRGSRLHASPRNWKYQRGHRGPWSPKEWNMTL